MEALGISARHKIQIATRHRGCQMSGAKALRASDKGWGCIHWIRLDECCRLGGTAEHGHSWFQHPIGLCGRDWAPMSGLGTLASSKGQAPSAPTKAARPTLPRLLHGAERHGGSCHYGVATAAHHTPCEETRGLQRLLMLWGEDRHRVVILLLRAHRL